MEVITSPGAGGIVGCGNRDTFVRWNTRAGELSYDPTVRDLIVKCHGVTEAAGLANAAETAPDRSDTNWTKDRSAGGLIPDLKTFVNHLQVLRLADFTIRVRRRAAATHAGEGDTGEVKNRSGNARRETLEPALLRHRVCTIGVLGDNVRVFRCFPFLLHRFR